VVGGQLASSDAFELVTSAARVVMGLPALEVAPGSPADLVAIAAGSRREAVAAAPPERLVFRRGELVVGTHVDSTGSVLAQSHH
jgi:cytosine deaminase